MSGKEGKEGEKREAGGRGQEGMGTIERSGQGGADPRAHG